jgi:hypothetical protein
VSDPVERWALIPNWGGYYSASDAGRIWSRYSERVLKPYPRPEGHLLVDLRYNGARRVVRVHRLVLETFVGPCPDGMEACHANGDPADNRLVNLRWDTRRSNNLDRVRHGTHHLTSRTHCPRGHKLEGRNLKPSVLAKGRRECWACARVRALVRYDVAQGRKPRDLQMASDQAYSRIMEGFER